MKKRLLYIGDAVCGSGFARASHAYINALLPEFDVTVLALNFNGDAPIDPKTGQFYPFPIYPCNRKGDGFGLNRVKEMVAKCKPDVIVIQNDPWNIPEYMQEIFNVPVVAIVAVDGKNCRGYTLNDCELTIFWTQFGLDEARAGGFTGKAMVIPLGVDLDTFRPLNRRWAINGLGFPEYLNDKFIVGNVNRNQPRKRLDLTVEYFAEWVHSRQVDDAYLYLHVCPTGDYGWDLPQLMRYYGFDTNEKARLLIVEPDIFHGISDHAMAATYNIFDVQLTTTQGEGFGLPAIEGMACGIPQIFPDWAALPEVCGKGGWPVPCSGHAATFNYINTIGGVPDKAQTIEALDTLYRDRERRKEMGRRAFSRAREPQFRWENIGEALSGAVLNMLNEREAKPVLVS